MGIVFFLLDVLFVHNGLASSFIFALGMVVAFIPEGLLPTVTLSLAMAVQRMSKRNALVKNSALLRPWVRRALSAPTRPARLLKTR